MNIVNLRAGQRSQPFQIGVGAVVGISSVNVGSWSANFEYSYATPAQVLNEQATWTAWPAGTVTAAAQDTALYPMFVRCNCVTGQIVASIGDNTVSTAIPSIPWATSISLITPTGTLAGAVVPSTTWAARPLPVTSYPNATIRITDVGGNTGAGGGAMFFTNGTRWKPTGAVLVDSIDTPNTSVANTTEQNLNPNRVPIPAGVIGANGDRLRFRCTMSKSGVADTCTLNLRFGPLGTIADPILATITSLATTSVSLGFVLDFKRISATSLQKEGNASTDNAYGGANSGSFPAAVTISSLDANGMFMSICSVMTSGTETVTVQDYALEFWPTDSA
jgi:hypothetical protein